MKTAMMVSMEISRGRELDVATPWEEVREEIDAVLVECRAECSAAE